MGKKTFSENKPEKAAKGFRVRTPLVVKLIGITSIIVAVSMTAITLTASIFFINDSRARAEENNLTLSELISFQVESEIRSLYSGALSLFDTLRESAGNRALEQLSVSNYFDRNALIAYIGVPGEKEVYSPKFFLANELESSVVLSFLQQKKPLMERARAGETILVNASPVFGVPAAALMCPYRDFGTENLMVIIFSTENLQAMVQTDAVNTTWVVSYDGELLAHPDFELVKTGVNFSRCATATKIKSGISARSGRFPWVSSGSSPVSRRKWSTGLPSLWHGGISLSRGSSFCFLFWRSGSFPKPSVVPF